jgi:chorismate mutase
MKNTQSLIDLRKRIDALDDALISLLAKRMDIVRTIAVLKRQKNMPPLDPIRWNKVISTLILKGGKRNLPEPVVRKIWNTIHRHALDIESQSIP